MELLKLYTALLRRRWLVLQSVVFFTVAGAVLALALPKNYEASARVLVSSSDATMSILSDLGLSEVAQGLTNAGDDIQNKIQLAVARPVMDKVIWKLQLRDSDGKLYTFDQVLVAGLTGELEARPNVSVIQQQGTDLLIFQARADDPELARLLADTLVLEAVGQAQDRARADTVDARRFIEEQLHVVQAEFDSALEQISDAKAQEEIVDIDSEMRAAVSRLSSQMLDFEQNAASIQETRARLNEQRAYQAKETADLVSPATAQVNERIEKLRDTMLSLQQTRAQELTSKTAKHPDVLKLDSLLLSTQEDLARAIEEQHALDPSVQQLESQLAGLRQKGAEITAGIERTTVEFALYPEKLRRLSQLQLAASAAENVYKSLQEERFQIGVAEALLVSDLQFIEPAVAPDKQSSPKLLVNLVLGFIVGLAFGLGLAFLFEYVDDSVKTPADVAEVWPLTQLGVVPRYKATGAGRTIDELPQTHPVAEAYRTIRNGLLYASLDKPLQLIGVTSSMPGDGKSTFAVNLAISLAREGKRVLVVDCDLRRPTQHRQFSTISNHQGLADVLARKINVEEAIQASPIEGLSMLTSGTAPADPAKMVESLRLRQLLLDLREVWDVVVIDLPPVLVVNDAMVVARAIDGLVVVAASGETGRKLLIDMKGRFEAAGISPVGIVLNKLDFATSGYGHYAKAYKHYLDASPGGQTKGSVGGKT